MHKRVMRKVQVYFIIGFTIALFSLIAMALLEINGIVWASKYLGYIIVTSSTFCLLIPLYLVLTAKCENCNKKLTSIKVFKGATGKCKGCGILWKFGINIRTY